MSGRAPSETFYDDVIKQPGWILVHLYSWHPPCVHRTLLSVPRFHWHRRWDAYPIALLIYHDRLPTVIRRVNVPNRGSRLLSLTLISASDSLSIVPGYGSISERFDPALQRTRATQPPCLCPTSPGVDDHLHLPYSFRSLSATKPSDFPLSPTGPLLVDVSK